MAKVKSCHDSVTGKLNGNYYFRCPATGQQIEVATVTAWEPTQLRYVFNGDLERPTFMPAIKMVNGKDTGSAVLGVLSDCTVNHFTVQDGLIRYFDDCTHHLKGRVVPMIEL